MPTAEQLQKLVAVLQESGPFVVGIVLGAIACLFAWISYRLFLEVKVKDEKITAMYEERLGEAKLDRLAALEHQKQIIGEMGKFRDVMERYERRIPQ